MKMPETCDFGQRSNAVTPQRPTRRVLSANMEARESYEHWHGRFDIDENADAPWHRMLRRHLDPQRDVAGKHVLEIGCGRGGFTTSLAHLGSSRARIVAADFSNTAVQKGFFFATKHNVGNISWEVADIQAIPHPAESFDTVISCETIEHVADAQAAVHELARVLKRGGRLFVTTPNYFGAVGLYRLYLRLSGRTFTEVGQPINTPMLLLRTRNMIRRCGLQVIAIDGMGHYIPFPGRRPIRVRTLDKMSRLTKWIALHSLIEAVKPGN